MASFQKLEEDVRMGAAISASLVITDVLGSLGTYIQFPEADLRGLICLGGLCTVRSIS